MPYKRSKRIENALIKVLKDDKTLCLDNLIDELDVVDYVIKNEHDAVRAFWEGVEFGIEVLYKPIYLVDADELFESWSLLDTSYKYLLFIGEWREIVKRIRDAAEEWKNNK